jgi:hypothetical protein
MSLNKAQAHSGLLSIMGGRAVPPNWVSHFMSEGWIEAVHVVTKEPVPADHPQAVLKLTEAGQQYMAGDR